MFSFKLLWSSVITNHIIDRMTSFKLAEAWQNLVIGSVKTEPQMTSPFHVPLARYVKLRFAHMPGTFSPPSSVSKSDMHHGTCVTHVPWCMPGSLTNGFRWSRWRGKSSRHSRRMRNPQIYVSGKRPMCYSYLRSHQRTTASGEIVTTTTNLIPILLSISGDVSWSR